MQKKIITFLLALILITTPLLIARDQKVQAENALVNTVKLVTGLILVGMGVKITTKDALDGIVNKVSGSMLGDYTKYFTTSTNYVKVAQGALQMLRIYATGQKLITNPTLINAGIKYNNWMSDFLYFPDGITSFYNPTKVTALLTLEGWHMNNARVSPGETFTIDKKINPNAKIRWVQGLYPYEDEFKIQYMLWDGVIVQNFPGSFSGVKDGSIDRYPADDRFTTGGMTGDISVDLSKWGNPDIAIDNPAVPGVLDGSIPLARDVTIADEAAPAVPYAPDLTIPKGFPIELPNVNVPLTDRFPFCVPFDLINVIRVFKADPKAPKFIINISKSSIIGGMYFELDFAQFEKVAALMRFFTLAGFVVFLIKISRNIIKG